MKKVDYAYKWKEYTYQRVFDSSLLAFKLKFRLNVAFLRRVE